MENRLSSFDGSPTGTIASGDKQVTIVQLRLGISACGTMIAPWQRHAPHAGEGSCFSGVRLLVGPSRGVDCEQQSQLPKRQPPIEAEPISFVA
jgi:hypothetical protein